MRADALARILKFNAAGAALQSAAAANGEAFKVLVLDKQTKDIIAPLLKVSPSGPMLRYNGCMEVCTACLN